MFFRPKLRRVGQGGQANRGRLLRVPGVEEATGKGKDLDENEEEIGEKTNWVTELSRVENIPRARLASP